MNPDDLNPGPILHTQLPLALRLRAETVRSVLLEVLPMNADEWINTLKRELNPELEVLWWERVAGCYVKFTASREMPTDQKQSAFKIIFGLLSGLRPKDLAADSAKFPLSERIELRAILRKSWGW